MGRGQESVKAEAEEAGIDMALEKALMSMFPEGKTSETLVEGLQIKSCVEEVVEATIAQGEVNMEVEVHRDAELNMCVVVDVGTRRRVTTASDSDDVLTPAQRPGKKAWVEMVKSAGSRRHHKQGAKDLAGTSLGVRGSELYQ